MTKEYKRNHYIPQWYQKCFFPDNLSVKKFFYLNLNPDIFVDATGQKRKHNALQRLGPPSCFKEDDLYTTKFGGLESTEIERKFFGKIDDKGKDAIGFFQDFEHPNVNHTAFQNLIIYLSVQKLRTPKGLEGLSRFLKTKEKNNLLLAMQKLQQLYCAIWSESIWAIVDASQSKVKFILSDHPVTVYNMGSKYSRTKWCRDKADPEVWMTGTHTLFPLNQNKLLILTNQSWVRNPYDDPMNLHPNPNPFRDAVFDFTEIQTGRKLSELEVTKINYIIKKRAHRYIAAVEKEWLYPEKKIPNQSWQKLGKEYLLMPDPRSVKFITSIGLGYSDDSMEVFDSYGRRPWQSGFQDKHLDEKEWKTFHTFQKEYEKLFGDKRRGVTFD